ncbi:hypothetical protein [Tepidanaerobacter sp. EBM-38]|jgi:hypothetical protein|uniref:hypothetical protein n=1 Tax=Tepidanaerobacter sp. EBM-38 TaxID=1918496 RepID=UPI000ABED933|nr:hypothetical protein [Tepidanaerobacter sp. EBM-38]
MQDCFAYKHNSCTALKVRQCEGCSFYKTKEQYELDRQKAIEKILSLDEDKRDYIIKTYYGGKLEVLDDEG